MSVRFIDLDIEIPKFEKPRIRLPEIQSLNVEVPTVDPDLPRRSFSQYNPDIYALIQSIISDITDAINNTIQSIKDSSNSELNNIITSVIAQLKLDLLRIQEKYYLEIRSLRDRLGAVSYNIPHGSMLQIYSSTINSAVMDVWERYIGAKLKLADAVRSVISSIFEKFLSILKVRDSISDEIAGLISVVRNLDITRQSALISEIINYHNAVIDLIELYAESKVLVFTSKMNALIEANTKLQEAIAKINETEIDNNFVAMAGRLIGLEIDRNILNQRVLSLEMYNDIAELEKYSAELTVYNANIRKFSAEIDQVFMPFKVFSRQMDAASAMVSVQDEKVSVNRTKIGTARLLIDADFDLKSANYNIVRSKVEYLNSQITALEIKIKNELERAELILSKEYIAKLRSHLESVRSIEESWIQKVAANEKALRMISMSNEVANKLYQTVSVRDAMTTMKTRASEILGYLDRAGEVVRAAVIGCSEVTAEIVRSYQ